MHMTHIARQVLKCTVRILHASDFVVRPAQGLDTPTFARDQICMVRTIYCVQPYVRSAGRLAKGHMRRLLSRDAAIRAARGCQGVAAGVVVYRVTGCWEVDFWSDPVLIARAGEVPAEAA